MEDCYGIRENCCGSSRGFTLFKYGEPERIGDADERTGFSGQASYSWPPGRTGALRYLPMPPSSLATVLLVWAMANMPTVLGLAPTLVVVVGAVCP